MVAAPPTQTLVELSRSISVFVTALDPTEEVAEKLQKNAIDILPVLDIHHRLLGIIRGADAIEVLKENIAANVQTMVGASADERALSSSFFAVRKRQPWLQVNLLTGFLAASVVGLFESTIAQFTALAVLMPVAAGQSGNTGAQALAVTMRGLTLREITVRHWFKVMIKEAGAGFINGVAVAATCGLGVYFWSDNLGLAMVLAMAMIISMTIAGVAGALVPICLKKLGQDPAQSSSIILTTVTDIAGFMSFLGIATALSSLLI
jgi:magnesium transporter